METMQNRMHWLHLVTWWFACDSNLCFVGVASSENHPQWKQRWRHGSCANSLRPSVATQNRSSRNRRIVWHRWWILTSCFDPFQFRCVSCNPSAVVHFWMQSLLILKIGLPVTRQCLLQRMLVLGAWDCVQERVPWWWCCLRLVNTWLTDTIIHTYSSVHNIQYIT